MKQFKTMLAATAATAVLLSGLTASAQVPLKTYADEKGYLNIRTLSCAQLAGTTQEDADFLGVWYSGWLNGHMKRHSINPGRVKKALHEVIVYCKAHPDTMVVDAVGTLVQKMQNQ